ncbi:MAG: argininosuccinate synthase [Clostridia bacterium]|nr:argininosuccinate synthase [Clostridia bacterium]
MSEKRIVLEYTGDMVSSVMSKWLEVEQGYEVIAAYYNYGQPVDMAEMKKKALLSGAKKFCVIDLNREGFVVDVNEHMQRELTQLARIEGATCVAFAQGSFCMGMNDLLAEIAPELQIVEPFEMCWVQSREDQIDFLKKHHVPVGIATKEYELRNDFAAFCDWHKRRDVYGITY